MLQGDSTSSRAKESKEKEGKKKRVIQARTEETEDTLKCLHLMNESQY